MTEEEKKELSPTEKAQAAADSLKKENDRAEELKSERILSGQAEAGEIPKQEEKKEVSDKDYADALLKGKILS